MGIKYKDFLVLKYLPGILVKIIIFTFSNPKNSTMSLKIKRGILIISFLAAGFILKAQSADDIIHTYISKIGGAEKWKSLTSMVTTGTTTIQGMDLPYTVSSLSPNMNRVEVSAMGQSVIQAYDGKNAWTVNPFQGSGKPELMNPDMGKAFSEQNQLNPLLIEYAAKGLKAALIGQETLNGVVFNKIEITHPLGDKDYYLFDAKTGLLGLVRKTSTTGPAAGKLVEIVFTDYKDESGLFIPHTMETKVDGQTFTKNLTLTVKLNVPLDAKIFNYVPAN